MGNRLGASLAAMLVIIAMVAPSIGAEADLPSPAEIQKLLDSGEYAAALRQVQRVLALNTTASAAYDRYDMLMLKAECELQLRQQPAALDALAAARKEAFAEQKPERAADPIALAYLLQNSKMFQYVPLAAGTHNPIPVLDRSRRGEAYGALLADMYPGVRKRAEVLPLVKTIPPLMEIAKSAGTLYAVEYAQTRDSKLMGPLAHAIATRAQALLDSPVTAASARVATISESAQELITEIVPTYDPSSHKSYMNQRTRRTGPTAQEVQYLQQTQTMCEKVTGAATDFAQALDSEFDTMKATAAKADTLKLRVHDILSDNYLLVPGP